MTGDSIFHKQIIISWVMLFAFLGFSSAKESERIKRFDVVELGVSNVKWVYLQFKSDVSSLDHGTEEIQIERTNVSSIIRIRSKVPFFDDTHVTIITKDGEVHTFHLRYELSPKIAAARIVGGSMDDVKVISSMKIQLSDDRTSHVTFPKKVVDMSVGCDSAMVDRVPNTDNMVMAKCFPYDTNLFKETSLTVVTEDKSLYAFDVSYNKNPEILNFSVDEADRVGALFSAISVNETDMTKLGESVIAKGAVLNRGVVEGKMTLSLQSIFIKEDVVMFHLAIANNSQIDYDIDFVKCYITNRKGIKKQTLQSEEIPPLYEYVKSDRPAFVPAFSVYRLVLFYKRFTIPEKHDLYFELFEKNGGRHLSFSVSNHDLLNAKVLK